MADSGMTDDSMAAPADRDEAGAEKKTSAPRKKRRWLRRIAVLLGVGFVLLIGLVATAPYLLATRAGLDQLSTLVSNRIVGWVEVDSATLSWVSPVELRGVRILDAEKREVLKVDRVSAANNLLSAIFSGLSFGEAKIETPEVTLYFDAANEISLLQALQPRNPSPTETASGPLPRPRGRIVLSQGRLTAARDGVPSVEIADINLDLRLDTLSTIAGDLGLTLPDGVRATGRLDVRELADNSGLRPDRAAGTLALKTDGGVQLAPLTAVFAPGAAVSGSAAVDVSASTEGGATRGKFAIQLTKVQAQETTAGLAPVDLGFTGEVSRSGEQLTAKALLAGDAGQVEADLTYRFATAETASSAERILAALVSGESATLPDFSLDVRGGVDLARLQKAIPKVMPVRPGSQISSGRLEIASVKVCGGADASASGSIAVRDLAGTEGGRPVRIEPVTLDFDAGLTAGAGLRLAKADLKSSFATLTASGDAASIKAVFRASLARLQQDLGPLLDLSALRLGGELGGQIDLTRSGDSRVNVGLTANGTALRFGSASSGVDVQRFSARQTGGLLLSGGRFHGVETGGELSATGIAVDGATALDGDTKVEWQNLRIDAANTGVRAELVRLTSAAANVDARNIQLQTSGRLTASADVQANADLGRLFTAVGRIARMAKPPAIGGRLALDTRVATNGDATTFAGRGGIDQLQIGEGAEAVREPRVNLEFDAGLDSGAGRIRLSKASLASAPLTAEITGTIEQYDGACNLALRGRYDASWEQLTRLLHELAPATAATVIVSGKSVSQFEITGPLNQPGARPGFRGVTSGVDVSWTAAELYGVKLGPATLKPNLRDGRLTLPPTAVAVSDGRANLGATIDFTGPDTTLVLPGSTKVLDNVPITPLIGQALLSRINPIFMHMTKVEGRAHLAVQDVFLPLGESAKRSGRGSGMLDLQSVRVQPSGLMGLLLELGGYADDQTHAVQFGKLDFVVRDGRIVYDNFTMVLPPDFDLKFRGSVGLDSTLDLIVSLPVREGLLKQLGLKGPALAAAQKLSGVRIELPLVGTRENPQVDFKKVDVAKLLGQSVVPDSPEKAIGSVLDILKQTQKKDPKKKP